MSDDSKVKVAIRVRPFNRREIELETQCVVEVNGQQVILHNPSSSSTSSSSSATTSSANALTSNSTSTSGSTPTQVSSNHGAINSSANTSSSANNTPVNTKTLSNDTNGNVNSKTRNSNVKCFTFDHCFWSFNEKDTHFASQEKVYNELGLPVLEAAFQGYNACIFAYGQTGSGKSYTMMGSPNNKGLIPRLCDGIFERIHCEQKDASINFKIEVSYMEIYNEKVHDLLDPRGLKQNLRVREHNILGPYVDGLSKLAVSSFEQIDNLMSEGNKSRTVAATNMNSESSRSHAVFSIILTCLQFDAESGVTGEKVSKMSLVDLAGSERAVKTGAVGDRLKEGSNINKSLTTLGLVISKLADSSAGKSSKDQFVPYRDSVLTWLLKDNLGGNSKTVMVATVSPAADNYDESLSTLRYADRAKRIVNHAVVNEDPNARMIRELREEVEVLREQLKMATNDALQERLAESEKLIKEMTLTWEERLRKTELLHQERQKQLEKMGISVQSSGIKVETDKYYLVNLNSDPALNELLVYYLKEETLVGRADAKVEQDIQLSGIGIQEQHAVIEIDQNENQLYMIPMSGARTCVNGSVISKKTALSHGDRILWGNNHFFKVACPKRNSSINANGNSSGLNSVQQQITTTATTSQSVNQSPRSTPCSNDAFNSVSSVSPYSSMSRDMNKCVNLSTSDDYSSIDFEFAQEELMMKQLSNDPIHNAMKTLEKQHEEDKAAALEKQREMYEKQLTMLRNQISSPNANVNNMLTNVPFATLCSPLTGSFDGFTGSTCNLLASSALSASMLSGLTSPTSVQSKMDKWAAERDELFKKSLARLKEDIVKANSLVLEANAFAAEMSNCTEFQVTLQIPAANLSPNRKKGAFVSEPAILVKRKNKASQIWSLEKLENKLIDMREVYAEWKSREANDKQINSSSTAVTATNSSSSTCSSSSSSSSPPSISLRLDPFYESQETHHLIGVASIFLEVLFHDVTLDYHVPIISQQGEVAGRLQIEVCRFGGQMGERMADANDADEACEVSSTDSYSNDARTSSPDRYTSRNQVAIRVSIKSAKGLPIALSNYVFCQYTFWGCKDAVVVPVKTHVDVNGARTVDTTSDSAVFTFDHSKEFVVNCTEEFLEHCAEGAIAIEVWGHRSAGFTSPRHSGWEVLAETQIAEANRSLSARWAELKRKIELWIQIQELNENGEYSPVEVIQREGNLTGGVYQLRQGQQRRIGVTVNPYAGDTGTLPVVCEAITSVAIGAIQVRPRNLAELDSYQDDDLRELKEKWKNALDRRRIYLRDHMLRLDSKTDKTEEDEERGKNLLEKWVNLIEEEKALDDPHADIPGADLLDQPNRGMEAHTPVIFLDFNTDDMSHISSRDSVYAGLNLFLPKEHNAPFFNLPIIRHDPSNVAVTALWDSSIHDSQALNRISSLDERITLIVRVSVRLTHPAVMDVILRKRISINVYKRQSLTDRIKKRISRSETLTATGVTYEMVSSIPKESEYIEDPESLATLAASGVDNATFDGETYIEKYTKGVSAVEGILTLDRLRQQVAVKELLANKFVTTSSNNAGCSDAFIKKTLSVPNFGMNSGSSGSMNRLDYRSEYGSSFDIGSLIAKASNLLIGTGSSTGSSSNLNSAEKHPPEGKPNAPMSSISPHPGKASIKPMKTVIETENDYDDTNELLDDLAPASNGHSSCNSTLKLHSVQSISSTNQLTNCPVDSTKSIAPSLLSSGYGSQLLAATPVSEDDGQVKPCPPELDDTESISSHCTSADGSNCSNAASRTEIPDWLILGCHVTTLPDGKSGTVRFLGTTHFQPGEWVGIELTSPTGKNDGSIDGVSYFSCKNKFGIFVKPNKCRLLPASSTSPTHLTASPLNLHGKLPLTRK